MNTKHLIALLVDQLQKTLESASILPGFLFFQDSLPEEYYKDVSM